MSTISASAARQNFPAQLDRVEAGEEVAITRHGRVVAVLVSPETLKHRRASKIFEYADEVGRRLEEARRKPLQRAEISSERATEFIESVREGRESR